MLDAHAAIEEFNAVARELIARGAEVIIPGCGLIAPCLRFAPGCQAEYPNGVTEVDGVPIVDIYGATIKTAETLVALKARRLALDKPQGTVCGASTEAIEGGRSVLEYTGPGILGLLLRPRRLDGRWRKIGGADANKPSQRQTSRRHRQPGRHPPARAAHERGEVAYGRAQAAPFHEEVQHHPVVSPGIVGSPVGGLRAHPGVRGHRHPYPG